MRPIRRGDRGPAVAEIRSILTRLDPSFPAASALDAGDGLDAADALDAVSALDAGDAFDEETERAVRAFQQQRGLTVGGEVDEETWLALDAARWRLGSRALFHAIPHPLIGEDVRTLQERLLEMGYDVGRPDSVYGTRTAKAVGQFQREVGLSPDGEFGPQTMTALRRLGRKVVGGRPQWLREAEAFRQSGPHLLGKTVVIDPGHGGPDPGIVVPDGPLRWTESDLAFDLASRLEGRLAGAGMRVHLTRGPHPTTRIPDKDRAQLANDLHADLLISIHIDGYKTGEADGVATYHYGDGTSDSVTATVAERLAGLVQREIVARTGLRDCHTHAKKWDLLRLTRMPAVRVELGYLTAPLDRGRLVDPLFREQSIEAIVAAVQRMYFPVENDVPTGSIDVRQLRMAVAGALPVKA